MFICLGLYLNAIGRNDVAKAVVIITQELGEVVQQDKQHSQSALVEESHGLGQLGIPQEWCQEFEQVDQQLSIHSPTLKEKINTLAHKNYYLYFELLLEYKFGSLKKMYY